jgi:hypothetical protein
MTPSRSSCPAVRKILFKLPLQLTGQIRVRISTASLHPDAPSTHSLSLPPKAAFLAKHLPSAWHCLKYAIKNHHRHAVNSLRILILLPYLSHPAGLSLLDAYFQQQEGSTRSPYPPLQDFLKLFNCRGDLLIVCGPPRFVLLSFLCLQPFVDQILISSVSSSCSFSLSRRTASSERS